MRKNVLYLGIRKPDTLDGAASIITARKFDPFIIDYARKIFNAPFFIDTTIDEDLYEHAREKMQLYLIAMSVERENLEDKQALVLEKRSCAKTADAKVSKIALALKECDQRYFNITKFREELIMTARICDLNNYEDEYYNLFYRFENFES